MKANSRQSRCGLEGTIADSGNHVGYAVVVNRIRDSDFGQRGIVVGVESLVSDRGRIIRSVEVVIQIADLNLLGVCHDCAAQRCDEKGKFFHNSIIFKWCNV